MKTTTSIARSALLVMALWSAGAAAGVISFVPSGQDVTLGEQVEVDVRVSGLANGLGAYSFDVRFDPSLLFFVGAGDAGGLGEIGVDTLGLSWEAGDGLVTFFDVSFLDPAALLDIQPDAFSLLGIVFGTLAEGVSPLIFDAVALADAEAAPLGVNAAPANVRILTPVPEPGALTLLFAGFAAALLVGGVKVRVRRAIRAALSLLALCGFAGAAHALPCDADADSDVDRNDVSLIQQAVLKKIAPSLADPRDANGNGVIDSVDARICTLRCTRAGCATNLAPIAHAGPDQTVAAGAQVVLDGGGSSDADDDLLTFVWTLSSRPADSLAQLDNVAFSNPRFVADKPGTYEIQLVVRDGVVTGAADSVLITATNATGVPPSTVVVDPSLQPLVTRIPGFDGEPDRTVAALTDASGLLMHFVANEIIVVSDDSAAVAAVASRWGGTVARSFLPGHFGLGGSAQHLVRIDPSTVDPARLVSDLQSLQPNARSDVRVSSDAALRVLAAAAREGATGTTVGLNIVSLPDTIENRSTNENASLIICMPANTEGPGCTNGGIPLGGPNTERFNSNAFLWSYMAAGTVQNIGVGEAWRALSLAGLLDNKVTIGVIDGGFSQNPSDNPADITYEINSVFKDGYPENDVKCTGGQSCPWHGDNVVSAAMGPADDNRGAAGPAGPVARAVTVRRAGDVFSDISAVAIAFTSDVKVLNMSWHARVPAAFSFTLLPWDLATSIAHDAGMVLIASSGNNNVNVDGEDCFIECWEEAWFAPCENSGVICVGALAGNATFRLYVDDENGSNYGDEEVDIFGPGAVWVGGDGDNPEPDVVFGTSVAAPFVAGVAALVLAADPSLSAAEVEQILIQTAHPSPDSTVRRYVNALGAVNQALGGSPVCLPPQLNGGFGGTTAIPLITCQDYSYSIDHSPAFGPFQYQWRKWQGLSTVDLADTATMSGTRTDHFSFHPFRPKDAGPYDVVVSNICGVTTSGRLHLAVLEGALEENPLPPLPAPLQGHAMASDRARGRLVAYGGFDFDPTPVVVGNIRFNGKTIVSGETWERDANGQWQVLSPPDNPPERYWHALAYDEARGVTVLFGGFVCESSGACSRDTPGAQATYGDTWEWDGTTWRQRLAGPSPQPRWGHSMTYDSVRRRVVLYGGINTFGTALGDLWEWDGTVWTQRATVGDVALVGERPQPRWQAGFAFDRNRNVYVLHGGRYAQLPPRQVEGDTWELSALGQWTLKATAPSSQTDLKYNLKFETGMAFDDFGRTLLATTSNVRNMLWQWDGVAWKALDDLPVGGRALVYDAARKRTSLVGGGWNTWSLPHTDDKLEWHFFDQSCNDIP